MGDVSYERFQQEIGNIIIAWSRVEERFRALLCHVAGLEGDAGEIVFGSVSANKQRDILIGLGRLRHSPGAQDDLKFCAGLHAKNAANRNLFAHGHIGFVSLTGWAPFALRFKPHVSSTVVQRGWNVQWSDVEKIAPTIRELDEYIGAVLQALIAGRSPGTGYTSPARPSPVTDFSASWFDLAKVFSEGNEV